MEQREEVREEEGVRETRTFRALEPAGRIWALTLREVRALQSPGQRRGLTPALTSALW